MKRKGCVAVIEMAFVNDQKQIIFIASLLLRRRYRIGHVLLKTIPRLSVSPKTQRFELIRLARLARALGVKDFEGLDAFCGKPFILRMGDDCELGEEAGCIIAHSWDSEPLSEAWA